MKKMINDTLYASAGDSESTNKTPMPNMIQQQHITYQDFQQLQNNFVHKSQERIDTKNFIESQIFKNNLKIPSRSSNLLNLASAFSKTSLDDREEDKKYKDSVFK